MTDDAEEKTQSQLVGCLLIVFIAGLAILAAVVYMVMNLRFDP